MATVIRQIAATIACAMAFSSAAYAAPPSPMAPDASTQRAQAVRAAEPGSIVVLRNQVIVGRTAKPMVTFVLARSFRAPTSLMSEEIWREQLDRIAAGQGAR